MRGKVLGTPRRPHGKKVPPTSVAPLFCVVPVVVVGCGVGVGWWGAEDRQEGAGRIDCEPPWPHGPWVFALPEIPPPKNVQRHLARPPRFRALRTGADAQHTLHLDATSHAITHGPANKKSDISKQLARGVVFTPCGGFFILRPDGCKGGVQGARGVCAECGGLCLGGYVMRGALGGCRSMRQKIGNQFSFNFNSI